MTIFVISDPGFEINKTSSKFVRMFYGVCDNLPIYKRCQINDDFLLMPVFLTHNLLSSHRLCLDIGVQTPLQDTSVPTTCSSFYLFSWLDI